jgi:malate dehydrogenase
LLCVSRRQYGYRGQFLGVPVKLGTQGVEQIVEIELTAEERQALDKSAASVRELLQVMGIAAG